MKPREKFGEFFFRHHWTFLAILFAIYAGVGYYFRECTWANTWLQTGAIAITIVFSVLLMIRSNKKNEEATLEKLRFYQEENKKHIEAVKSSVKEQMDHQTSISEKHITEARNETERIITAFRESTEKEIQSFIQHSQQLTDKLEDVVEHLAEINADNKEMLEHTKQQVEHSKQQTENVKKQTELEERKFEQRKNQLTNLLNQQKQTQLKYKPELQFFLEEDGILFIDLKFVLNNSGGEAASIQLDVILYNDGDEQNQRRFTKVISNLKRNTETSFYLTRAKKLRAYKKLEVRALVWDVNQNHYNAYRWYDRKDNQWFRLDLDDQNLIG